jgi:phosphomannomutase
LAIARIRSAFEPDAIALDETDGLSLDMGAWRFNLRRSNTEPLLRLNIEACDEPELVVEKLAQMRSLICLDV